MLCLGTKYDSNEMHIQFRPVSHYCMHNILYTCILCLQDKCEYTYVISTLQSRLSFHHCPEQITISLFMTDPCLWSECFFFLPPHWKSVYLFIYFFLAASGKLLRASLFFLSQMVGDSSSPAADIEQSLVFVSTGDSQSGLWHFQEI